MKIHFLGTGAADWPDPGEKVGDGRRLSSLVINDSLMIDCGMMTLQAIKEFGVDINALHSVLISHSHCDHYDIGELSSIAQLRSATQPPLRVFLHAKAVARTVVPADAAGRLELVPYETGDLFSCDGVSVTTLPANHELEDSTEQAAHFFLEFPDGKTMFYGLDGSWFLPPTWHFLQKHRLDYIVWELTCGELADWRADSHCNLGMVKLMTDSLRYSGVIDKNTVMFCSHMARTLCPPHPLLERRVLTEGYILAKDGLLWQG